MRTDHDQAAPVRGVASRSERGEELDIRAYLRVLRRRRWTALGVFAAIVLLTMVVTLRQTRIYAATTSIIIDLTAPKVLNSKDVQDVVETGNGGYWSSKEYYETQYKVITSRAVAQRVVEKLQLERDLRFLELDGIKEDARLKVVLARADAASRLQERLSVIPVKDSRVVRIQVEDRDPTWAANLANAVAEAYIAENLSVRSTTTQSASEWLETQLGDLETKLAKSADDLFNFKHDHDIVSTSWEDRQAIAAQRVAAVNDALTKTRLQQAQLLARNGQLEQAVEALRKDPQSSDGTMLLAQNTAFPELKIRYLDARVECADTSTRYLEAHPRAVACAAKVAAAKDSLIREAESTLSAARREYDENVDAERKLQKLLAETKADAFGLNQWERQYLELKRTHDNNQRLYEMVLQRLKETGVTGMLQMSNVRILDRAEPPDRPVSPKPVRNLALAVIVGALLGTGLVFFLEFLDTSLSTREQVEERLGLAFLGIVPEIKDVKDEGDRDRYVNANPRSATAECVRSIRTNLLFMSPDKPLRTILVTSSGPSEGKTTVATMLAETMAEGGNRVLLLDADLRRPRLHKIFCVANESGVSTLIVGEGHLETAVRTTGIANISVLPCGPVPPNPAELLHTEAFKAILAAAAQRFDRVIIDSPPAGVVADAVVVATQVDGALFVVKSDSTSRDAAVRAVRSMTDVKARILGVVLNEIDLDDARYGSQYYYYNYGYYHEDGKREEPAGA